MTYVVNNLNSGSRQIAITLGLLAGVAVLIGSPACTAAASPAAKTRWLCRPGLANDPCKSNRTATAVSATGAGAVQHNRSRRKPPIDCFYVYPTVSEQPTDNANRHVDPEVKAIAHRQASRFSRRCRVFAPMYRQITAPATIHLKGDADLAYRDVRNAWHAYRKRFNHGRGVVLIGHSQGSFMLDRLIRERIDTHRSVRRRLVSALLTGGNVVVKKGSDRGGDFQHIPACSSAAQTGCVVAYSTFNQTPPDGAVFGRLGGLFPMLYPWVGQGDPSKDQVLCVNPAALMGGGRDLHPYFQTASFPGPRKTFWDSYDQPPSAQTPWVTYPKLYRARCKQTSTFTWLEINDTGAPRDTRSRVEVGPFGPGLGLHVFDVNLALGDLVGLVRRESRAYVGRAVAR
jgi:hypothetical protein